MSNSIITVVVNKSTIVSYTFNIIYNHMVMTLMKYQCFKNSSTYKKIKQLFITLFSN